MIRSRLLLFFAFGVTLSAGCSRSNEVGPPKTKVEPAPVRATAANPPAEADAALKVALAHLSSDGDLMPEGVEVSIECFDAKDKYLRHKDGDAFLDPIVSEQDSHDARFKAVKGLADPKGLSFESYNYPGHYLRNKNGRLTVTKCPDEADRKDATFLIVMGLASGGDGWVSLELLAQPGYFVRNKNREVWAEQKQDDKAYLESATFRLVKPVPPQG